ncbi:MAG TPA: AbrB/MazE/SpoVT family DNA-binding domain-containing protein [Tepidiformaceae bacterium]|nr:AbrB/MazE/SpoVT family DNA-binding domain-containing protein [Tepidiformaceae bacterium]
MSQRKSTVAIRVGKRGTIVIPAALRRQLGFEEGDRLELVASGEELVVTRIEDDPVAQFRKVAGRFFEGVDPVQYQRELREDGP